MSIRAALAEIWDKTTFANVGAFIIVMVGLGASVYYQKWETMSLIVGAAVGYLFPKLP